MLPGFIRRPWTPPSRAAMAYFHWKWMSAITGMVACSAIALSACASSQCGTATRTISQPVATSAAICWSVALTSEVLVVVIDWTRTGASPPTSTQPTLIFRDFRRPETITDPVCQSPNTWNTTTRSFGSSSSTSSNRCHWPNIGSPAATGTEWEVAPSSIWVTWA